MTTFEDLIEQWARRTNMTDWKRQARKHQNQCVYILECKGVYKIGKTGDLNVRMKSLQIGNPFGMHIAHVIFTEDNSKVEHALHQIFADSRARDEWFNLSFRDIAVIKSMSIQQILSAADGRKPAEVQPDVDRDQLSFDW